MSLRSESICPRSSFKSPFFSATSAFVGAAADFPLIGAAIAAEVIRHAMVKNERAKCCEQESTDGAGIAVKGRSGFAQMGRVAAVYGVS